MIDIRKNVSEKAWPVLPFLAIALASFLCYWNASDIFFNADDFLWLERAKYTVANHPLSIFGSEGLYFDPLVYLLFWLNYTIHGLEPAWYHFTDLIIHIINAWLVAYLALLLTKSKMSAFLAGFIFTVSHTNSDSVLWPSGRVDTLAAIFYLSSIASYIRYHNSRKSAAYTLSIIFFALSLSAKSTPVILPVIILALEAIYFKACFKETLLRAIPFMLISVFYLILLLVASPKTADIVHVTGGLNTREFLRGISVFFFPESLIATNENLYTSLSALLMVTAVGLGILFIPIRTLFVILIMISVIISPLLFLRLSFVYATPSELPPAVLGSIYHRLYLGVIGFSILISSAISFIIERYKNITLSYGIYGLLTISIFTYGFLNIRERAQIWRTYGISYYLSVERVKRIVNHEGSWSDVTKIYLIDSPLWGFAQPIFRLYLDNCDVVIEHIAHYSVLPDIRSYQGKIAVLAYGKNDSYIDITPEVVRYQNVVYGCETVLEKKEREVCWNELPRVTQRIASMIDN